VRQRFANQVAGETTNHNVLTQLCDLGVHQFLDRLVGIFDKPLFQQTNRAVKFLQLAVHDLVHDRFRFAFHLRLVNFALGFNQIAGDIVTTHVERMRRGDVQRDILNKRTEIFVLGYEIGLAIHFD
jgi:hypothetical protein